MKKYTTLSLGIILIGIIISSAFLWLFLNKKGITNKNLINNHEFIQKSPKLPSENSKNEPLANVLTQNNLSDHSEKNTQENESLKEIELPNFVENQTPFISQAPFGIWDELHDEACEEAVIIIANGFLNKTNKISKEKADEEILKLVDWQMKKYGKHKDLNIEEIQDMAFEFYGNEFEISENVNEESFKKILAGGNIIIIPAAGRELGNPFFTPPGPLYHALVVIGYDDSTQEFITNDPGTRRGEGFRYSYETLLEGIHDFPGQKEEILEGVPQILIVSKIK